MLPLEIPINTAYNPMIYIPFFIVILIDKRGAKRGGKRGERERKVRTHNDTKNDTKNEKRQAPSGTQRHPAAPPPPARAKRYG